MLHPDARPGPCARAGVRFEMSAALALANVAAEASAAISFVGIFDAASNPSIARESAGLPPDPATIAIRINPIAALPIHRGRFSTIRL
jgi:hypothetical protein